MVGFGVKEVGVEGASTWVCCRKPMNVLIVSVQCSIDLMSGRRAFSPA